MNTPESYPAILNIEPDTETKSQLEQYRVYYDFPRLKPVEVELLELEVIILISMTINLL